MLDFPRSKHCLSTDCSVNPWLAEVGRRTTDSGGGGDGDDEDDGDGDDDDDGGKNSSEREEREGARPLQS